MQAHLKAPAARPDYARFEVRAATRADTDSLLALAEHLNTVNLPGQRQAIASLLDCSEQSFLGQLDTPFRKYVFLLWDNREGRAVGTSSLITKLGRKDAPYIYFDVLEEERYSARLDRHFRHELLRIGFSYDGPTELGGLVVDPRARRAPERLGRFISYVRFAFIAAQRSLFQDQLLAELLPPLEPDGTSHLWEALGRRFTEMSYAEADHMSSHDKDFIRDLFPRAVIYTSLLAERARGVVGQVGAQTRGVERMLSGLGFRYAKRVDPFDGGPHFVANTDDVSLVRSARAVSAPRVLPETAPRNTLGLALCLTHQPPFVRARLTPLSDSLPNHLPEQILRDLSDDSRELWVMAWPADGAA